MSRCKALAWAGIDAARLGALIFMSITGVSSPSVDARLINRMGLPPNIRRIPVFGLGCVGGAAGIAHAADYVLAHPGQIAALVSVETCSLTLQRDDTSIANLISSSLFGDGAASVLVAGAEAEMPGVSRSSPRGRPSTPARKTLWAGTSPKRDFGSFSRRGSRILSARTSAATPMLSRRA